MKKSVVILAALMALAALVQWCCVSRAVVPAQDSLRYIRIARDIDRHGLLPAATAHAEQPLFPALICLVHRCLPAGVLSRPDSWATASQLAAALPLVLTVLPLWFLYVRLLPAPRGGPFGARLAVHAAALVAVALFCVLPSTSRLGADGLSDSSHLLPFCCALAAMACYWTPRHRGEAERPSGDDRARPRPAWLLVAGLAIGLAALARAEVLLLGPLWCLAALWEQRRRHTRQAWGRVAAGGVWLALGSGVVLLPFLAATGSLAPRSAAARLLGRHTVEDPAQPTLTRDEPPAAAAAIRWRTSDGAQMSLSKKDPTTSIRFEGYLPAARQYADELATALQFWLGPLALWGVWSARRRLNRPLDRFAIALFAGYSLAVLQVASGAGYLSPRHLLPLVVLSVGWAAQGLCQFGGRVVRVRHAWRRWWGRTEAAVPAASAANARLAWTVVLVGIVAPLPRALAPLHASRLGHRDAGQWLAAAPGNAAVLDTRGWTGLHSGRFTYRFDQARRAMADARLGYLVLERHELEHDSQRSRSLRELVAAAGHRVAVFRPPGAPAGKAVEIYRWHPQRFVRRFRNSRLAN